MIIAIASGKGGTGKTTIATSLAQTLSVSGRSVSFLDCDVEEPNAHLFLRLPFDQREQVSVLIPEVNAEICTACGRCAEVCEFHAIVTLGTKTLVFPELCHGCGSCALVCPENAITEVPKPVGIVEAGLTEDRIYFSHGVLNIGEPMAVPVIARLKQMSNHSHTEVVIRDAPPGISCPVVETLRGADFVLLVTEPTPFGLHDLKLAVELTENLGIPAGVIVNRDGIGDTRVEEFCRQNALPILLRIPFDRRVGEGIAQGRTLVEISPEYQEDLVQVYTEIQALVQDSKAVR